MKRMDNLKKKWGASAVVLLATSLLATWAFTTPGRYICEFPPADSWGGYFPLYLSIDWNGGGRIWSPKPYATEYAVQVHLTENGDGFRMSGDGLYEWRAVETTVHTLRRGFASVEITVIASPLRSTNPFPRTHRFEKVIFPPAVTLFNLIGFALLLSPGLLWMLLGFAIEQPKIFKVWYWLTHIILLAYCAVAFVALAWVELFHSVIRYVWMPVLAVPTYIWFLRRLRNRYLTRLVFLPLAWQAEGLNQCL